MQELWCRIVYYPLFITQRITAVVRPDDRNRPNKKGVAAGELLKIRAVSRPGIEELSIPPTLLPWHCYAIATTVTVKTIAEISEEDLVGCSPDAATPGLLRYHLGLIYHHVFRDEDRVTIIR